MKTINNLRGLEDYGFNALTREACNLSFRVLVDMNEKACRLFNECFGLPPTNTTFEKNWNPKSIASVMLTPDSYMSLGVFALLDDGCHTVMQTYEGTIIGLEPGEAYKPENGIINDKGDWEVTSSAEIKLKDNSEWMTWPTCYGKVSRNYAHSKVPHVGNRNIHGMAMATTGRIT